mgnify:CR=1 FL=1
MIGCCGNRFRSLMLLAPAPSASCARSPPPCPILLPALSPGFVPLLLILQNPEVLLPHANAILTAVIGAMASGAEHDKIQAAAIKALTNSLEFCRENFNSKEERDQIMMVCGPISPPHLSCLAHLSLPLFFVVLNSMWW